MIDTMTNTTQMTMTPDQRVFHRHLEGARFQSGLDRGKWRLAAPVEWPKALIAVSAAERVGAPNEFLFRFDLTGYPQQAPNARLWDEVKAAPLEAKLWPFGEQRIQLAFNPNWKNGTAIYLPCDRLSFEGHDNWRHEHPDMIWTPDKDITFYLNILHDYLNARDYKGLRPA
jgi:hypothetical protein